jgi:hypothetical protein
MPDTGPHVQLAAFCEKVLHERDGVVSLIRVIDRITVQAIGTGAPDEIPAGHIVNATLIVALRSDQAKGRYAVRVSGEQPDTTRLPDATVDVVFEGEDRGVNLIFPMALEAQEGLYWFDILLGDGLLSRVPLRVMYQRMPKAL